MCITEDLDLLEFTSSEGMESEFFPAFVSQTFIPNAHSLITVNIFRGFLLFEYNKFNLIRHSDNFFLGIKVDIGSQCFIMSS